MKEVTISLLPQDLGGQDRFQRAFAVLEAGIDQRAFPGASVAIAHRGKLVALKGLGRFTYDPGSPPVTPATIYDLASLTKVVVTTPASMILYDRGALVLDEPLVALLPSFRSDDRRREQVTLRMLLAHSSGLPAYVKFFESVKNKDELLRGALQVRLEHDPAAHAEYSDIGFILLGQVLEKLAQKPLDVFWDTEIARRLGLEKVGFNPPVEWKSRIPPTEDDQRFRYRVLEGEANDENAWIMGGVAGHAGCFGTAPAIAELAECMLRGGLPLFQPHIVDLFTRRESSPVGTSRALGWDTPSVPSQSGKYFSARSYGHLGYTGTSLWIDPERQLSVTLLTNRTWPDRSSQSIKEFRPRFHDAVIETL